MIKEASANSCCGSGTAGVLAETAGYKVEELASLPSEMTVSSFGCGNPVAFSGIEAGGTVLDLGSGAGLDLILAAKKVGP